MATIYIAPTAQGSGNGTSEANAYAFSSLSSAESDAGSGGKILFLDGTYTVSSILQLGASNVTYEALNLKKAIIDFNNGSLSALELGTSAASYAGFALKGLVFKDIGNGTGGPSVEMQIASGQTLTCDQCEFTNMTPTARGAVGSYLTSNPGALNGTFTGCIFTQAGTVASVPMFGYRVSATHALTLNNCTLVFSGTESANFFKNQGTFTVKNSILISLGSNKTLGSPSPFTESHNCYFSIGQSADAANSIIVDDPQFVDSANSDFRLRPSSPCINAGTSS